MKNKALYLIVTLLALLAAGQTALAETKTVTYTITSAVHNSTTNTYDIVFTRSGDDPFDASATTYTTSVSSSSIGQSPGYNGNFHVVLADGFEMNVSWESGSNVDFDDNNYISPGASGKQITYSVSCTDDTYYVTHVTMQAPNGNWQDTNYDNQWKFAQNYVSAYKFGAITITYANTPPLSVFQSAGTNTYNIRNKDELRHLANYVNGGNNCNGLTFLQTQDITCDDTYMPIGKPGKVFQGTYNGQGNTVSGITVSRTTDGYIGLFGYVDAGKVENVILSNSTFTGNYNVGGIVGYNLIGTVQNCRVENTVTINAGTDKAQCHGGIVGVSTGVTGKVIGCISAATVSHNDKGSCIRYGGIVGELSRGTIKDCLYTGISIDTNGSKGAILGYNGSSSTLTNNYYTSINLGGVQGNDADGARRARTVTLGEDVMLVGSETAYSVSGLTAIGTGNYALRHGSTIYSGEGQTLTLSYTGTPATGYEFSGFSANAGTISGNTLTIVTSNVTVNAAFSPIEYTITYHSNGGSLTTTYNSYNIESPDITLDQPTKEGVVFVGWYDNENLTGTPVTTISTGSTGNKEFWAKFGKDFTQCTATVPDQLLGNYSYINYKFWAANEGNAFIGETVKDGETTLVLGTDYEFGNTTFADMTNHDQSDMPYQVGDECIVEIVGKGAYSGSKWASFTIVNPSGNGTWGDGNNQLSWRFANGELTITGTGAMDAAASNAGYPWYQYATYISTITIDDGVTSIASRAFGGTQNENPYAGVESVYFPSTLTSIGDYAFAYCTSLDLDLDSILEKVNAQDIGTGAFNQINSLSGTLSASSDNTARIGLLSQAAKADVTISGIAFNETYWYTMCLPFSVSKLGGEFQGAELMEIDMEGTYEGRKTGLDNGTYYLYFKPVTEITAGKPFLVSGVDITSNTFNGVRVYGDRTDAVSSDGKVKFMGSYARSDDYNSHCTFAVSNGTRTFSSKSRINAFGAYIQLTDAGISGLDSDVHDVNDVNAKCFTLTGTIGPATKALTGTLSDGFYWATFYDGTIRYTLPEGATAYTMDSYHHLYRLGTDGRTIPAGVAVVIISDKAEITLTRTADTSDITINGGGNILQGSDNEVLISSLSGTPYVLGVVNGVLGFHEYVPTNSQKVPAHKAYYVQ